MVGVQEKRLGFHPDYAVAPGETLKETVEALGIDQKDLARRTGLSEKHISQIMTGHASVTVETAQKLEMVTGVPAGFWNGLEVAYRQTLAEIEAIHAHEGDIAWMKQFPVRELIRRGKLAEGATHAMTSRNLLAFFGTASVESWKQVWMAPGVAWRKSKCFDSNPYVAATWLRLGELEAREVQCEPYVAERFRAALRQIRAQTCEPVDKAIAAARQHCAAAGVAVVLVREIKGCPASGVARWLTPVKALIQLSLRHKTDDHLWFSFFHEAGHILHDPKKQVTIEDLRNRDSEQELAADRFARDMLISPPEAARLRNLASATDVKAFAAELGIAPGIVAGRLQHDGLIGYNQMNELKRRLEWE